MLLDLLEMIMLKIQQILQYVEMTLILINAISLLHDRSMSISLLSYINLTYHPSGYKKYFEIVVIKLLYRKIFDKNLIDSKGTITFTT